MADWTQSLEQTIVSHQAVSLGADIAGEISVATYPYAWVQAWAAPVGTTANNNGMIITLDGCGHATENARWTTLATWVTSITAASQNAVNASEAAGQTDITVAAVTGFSDDTLIYIQDVGTLADSEWHRMLEATGTTISIAAGGLDTAKDSSDQVFDEAFAAAIQVDCSALSALRMTFNHRVSTAGSTMHVMALANLATDFE